MATIAIASYDTVSMRPRGVIVTFATTLGNADQTAPVRFSGNVAQLNVEISGTLGGATVAVQGSTDNFTTASTLHDADGTDLSSTVAIPRIENVRECNMPYIRATTAGGAGTAVGIKFVAQLAAP